MSQTSVFVLPSDRTLNPMDIKTTIEIFTGRKVIRIDVVDTKSRNARYMFVHFDREMNQTVFDTLMYSQLTFAVGYGYIRIGLNRSGGLNLSNDDDINQLIFNACETIYRNLRTGVHSRYDPESGLWEFFTPDIQEVNMEDDFAVAPVSPDPAPPLYVPPALKKKNKQPRRFKTEEERSIVRMLFV
jgi:hypothetical protein